MMVAGFSALSLYGMENKNETSQEGDRLKSNGQHDSAQIKQVMNTFLESITLISRSMEKIADTQVLLNERIEKLGNRVTFIETVLQGEQNIKNIKQKLRNEALIKELKLRSSKS